MRTLGFLILCFSLSMSIGCKAIKSLDSVIKMEKKMDEMNQKMDRMENMDKGLNKTNTTMDGMIVTMDELLGEMKKMIKLADKLELVIGFKLGVDLDHTHPATAMPGAKELTKAATIEELLDITYLQMKRIKGFDLGEGRKLSFEEKMSLAYSLNAIGYMMPAEKLEQMIDEEITGKGARINEAYILLAFRAQLLLPLLLDDIIMPMNAEDTTPINLSQLEDYTEKFVNYFNLLDSPFADKIKHPGIEILTEDYEIEVKYAFDLMTVVETMGENYSKDSLINAISYTINSRLSCSSDEQGRLEAIYYDLEPHFDGASLPTKQCN